MAETGPLEEESLRKDRDFFKAMEQLNNFLQGFVDMLPLGRQAVDSVHTYSYTPDKVTNRAATSYSVGQGAGLIWSLVLLRGMVPAMAGSKIPIVAKFGKLLLEAPRALDRARWAMEITRCTMYCYKLFKNQQRLAEGKITPEQFAAMQDKDFKSYMISGTIWAIPGTGGLWIAAGNLVIGTMMNEAKVDDALQRK